MSPATGLKHGEMFDGKGFYGWKFKIKLGLLQHKVWKCVVEENNVKKEGERSKDVETETTEDMENLAYTYIMLSLSDSVQAVVRDCQTARETWKRLEEKYGGREVQDRIELRERKRSIKMKESDRMIDHLAVLSDLVTQLKSAGGELPEEEIVLTLLKSLPKKYDVIKNILRARLSGSSLNLTEVQNSLLAEERNIGGEGFEEGGEQRVYLSNADVKLCYTCNMPGHISRNCSRYVTAEGKRLCFRCKSSKHIERDCPANGNAAGRRQVGQ